MKLHTIKTAHWQPRTPEHIRQVLRAKHKKDIKVVYKIGCDVNYVICHTSASTQL